MTNNKPITLTSDTSAQGLLAGDIVIYKNRIPKVTERVGSTGPYLRADVPAHPDGSITYKDPDNLSADRLEQVAMAHLAIVAELRKREAAAAEKAKAGQLRADIALISGIHGGLWPMSVPHFAKPDARTVPTAFGAYVLDGVSQMDIEKRAAAHGAWTRLERALATGKNIVLDSECA